MLVQALQQPIFTRSSDSKSVGLNLYQAFLANSGIHGTVSQKAALTLSAFYNGITVICNDYAKLPKGVFQKSKNGKGRTALFSHPVKYLIDKKPNQYMTAFNFDFIMLSAAILKGNSYAYIERNKLTSDPLALQYIDQDKTFVEVKLYNDKLWYKFDGKTIPADDMLHVPGFSFNGVTGIGVIRHAANSLGVSLSAQKYATDYYEQKSMGTGIITTDKDMKPDAKTRYSNAFTDMLSKKQSYKVPVLDNGMGFTQIKVTAQEAQFLLAGENGVNEVARWLNISAQKLKNNKDVNNSISESLERQHVSDSILPWAIKFQQEYDSKLFTISELKAGIYTKFNTESLLSADKSAQAEYWSKLIFAGVYVRNEVRAMLDLNPLNGLDEPLTPVNVQLMEQIDAKLNQLKIEQNVKA